MDAKQFRKAVKSIAKSPDAYAEASRLAADLPCKPNCEGTAQERFLAGWENAMVMRHDAGNAEAATNEGFAHYCLSELVNGFPDMLK